ncbi:FG-GAP and VCBS repeat-containing protein [Streptomyces populi]
MAPTVSVAWGGPRGLSGRTPLSFTPKYSPSPMIVGDFDGDGYADVAIGVMEEGISGVSTTGAVTVLRGSSKGLTTNQVVSVGPRTVGLAAKYRTFARWLAK